MREARLFPLGGHRRAGPTPPKENGRGERRNPVERAPWRWIGRDSGAFDLGVGRRGIYVSDFINRRILRVDLVYGAEAGCLVPTK